MGFMVPYEIYVVFPILAQVVQDFVKETAPLRIVSLEILGL
jgi:hypothetical protein